MHKLHMKKNEGVTSEVRWSPTGKIDWTEKEEAGGKSKG